MPSIPKYSASEPQSLLMPPSDGRMVPVGPGVQILDRPPTPPPRSPLSVHSDEGPELRGGMRRYEIKNIISTPDANIPFAIKEIPTFDRKTWPELKTYRYKVGAQDFPRSSDEETRCAELLKGQLLKMFGVKRWEEGEEPEVTFPTVELVMDRFVDIRFAKAWQHEKAREPRPKLRVGYEFLVPWISSAFVNERKWLVLQFSHPYLKPDRDGDYTDEQQDSIHAFGTNFRHAFISQPKLAQLGKLVKLDYLPEGYPHNPDYIPTSGPPEVRPEYIAIIKKGTKAKATQVTPPPFVQVVDPKGGEKEDYRTGLVGPRRRWVKLLWEGREDYCGYCKSATDGHLNSQCPKPRKPGPPNKNVIR